MHEHWIAERMKHIEVSGIRKVFDLAAHLKDPVNLSIGLPHFPVPTAIKEACQGGDRRGQKRLYDDARDRGICAPKSWPASARNTPSRRTANCS